MGLKLGYGSGAITSNILKITNKVMEVCIVSVNINLEFRLFGYMSLSRVATLRYCHAVLFVGEMR